MSNILQPIDNFLENSFGRLLKQPVLVVAVIKFIIVLYAAHLAPLPPQFVVLVNNVYFKLLFFTIILWTAQLSPSTALMLALAFVLTTNYASTGQLWEGYRNYIERLDGDENPAVPVVTDAAGSPAVPPAVPVVAEMGCYPMRQVNIEKVIGVPNEMLANFELTV